MQPIVDRLEAQYSDQIGVVRANAEDGGAGQAAFRALGLPGHPGSIILLPDGSEAFRGFGVLPEDTLRAALDGLVGVGATPTP
jgi:hypothetical protein